MSWTLVTGGAKHLGAAICQTLASQGHHIVVHYNHSANEAEEVAKKCRSYGVQAQTIQGDFSTKTSVEQFLANYLSNYADTSNLVNNVGNYLLGSALKTSLDDWYALFQNNLHVPLALMQALTPSLKQKKGGIVNIGVSGLGRADTYATAYTCAKHALHLLTKSVAKELAGAQVRVNMISPGYLETAVDLPKEMSGIPMHRPATLAEAAEMVGYLLSPAAAYITGQNIEVAGGLRL